MSITKSRNDFLLSLTSGNTIEEVLTNDLTRNSAVFISGGSLAQNTLSTEKIDLNYYKTTTRKGDGIFSTAVDKINSVNRVILLGKMSTGVETDFINVFYSIDDTNYILGHATRGTANPIDGKRHFVIELTDFPRYIKMGNVNTNTISNIDINSIFLK